MYRTFYKTLPRSSVFVNLISVRFYETDCILGKPRKKVIFLMAVSLKLSPPPPSSKMAVGTNKKNTLKVLLFLMASTGLYTRRCTQIWAYRRQLYYDTMEDIICARGEISISICINNSYYVREDTHKKMFF